MTITFVPKFMTFEEWKKLYPDLVEGLDKEASTDCSECFGTGIVECFNCGAEENCEVCNGEGKVKSNLVKDTYYTQLRKDKLLLKKWQINN